MARRYGVHDARRHPVVFLDRFRTEGLAGQPAVAQTAQQRQCRAVVSLAPHRRHGSRQEAASATSPTIVAVSIFATLTFFPVGPVASTAATVNSARNPTGSGVTYVAIRIESFFEIPDPVAVHVPVGIGFMATTATATTGPGRWLAPFRQRKVQPFAAKLAGIPSHRTRQDQWPEHDTVLYRLVAGHRGTVFHHGIQAAIHNLQCPVRSSRRWSARSSGDDPGNTRRVRVAGSDPLLRRNLDPVAGPAFLQRILLEIRREPATPSAAAAHPDPPFTGIDTRPVQESLGILRPDPGGTSGGRTPVPDPVVCLKVGEKRIPLGLRQCVQRVKHPIPYRIQQPCILHRCRLVRLAKRPFRRPRRKPPAVDTLQRRCGQRMRCGYRRRHQKQAQRP